MKIALAQINPTVGDIEGNSRKIVERIEEGRSAGASLVVFTELALCGYPPRDLLLKPAFIKANVAAVNRIAESCRGVASLVGFVASNEDPGGRTLRNSAAYCADGKVCEVRHKSLLPTYDVFDEHRYFEPSDNVAILEHEGVKLGVSICEDLWNDEQMIGRRLYRGDPVGELSRAGAKLLVNLSASPFFQDKHAFRTRLFGKQAAEHRLPILFVNQVGGNDELVFDGASTVIDGDGKVVAQAKAFDEDLLLVDVGEGLSGRIETYPERVASVHDALVTGTRDYVHKCGFAKAVIGLSGGIDSAVTAAIAAAALGAENVTGVAMPSRYSTEHSKGDARVLAENLGIAFKTIPIADIHAAYEASLEPHFENRPPDVTEENIQARIRGGLLMAMSNKFGSLLLTTGNKSELAVGYCTLYGDMCGGLAVISDVPKTLVYTLAEHINTWAGREIVPRNTIEKPPSAELRPDQKDSDSLPDYDTLDAILERYIEREESAEEIVSAGFDAETVRRAIRLVDVNEYKRKQAAPGLKVTSRAFGVGRRMPLAARYRY